MSATALTKHFDRPELLVDTTTTYDRSGVTGGPSFNMGVSQSREISLQIDWQNNTGNIDIILFGRSKANMNYSQMKFIDCDGLLIDTINMSGTFGSHMIHISRKFNDIDIRFVVNSGQANVKVSGIVE